MTRKNRLLIYFIFCGLLFFQISKANMIPEASSMIPENKNLLFLYEAIFTIIFFGIPLIFYFLVNFVIELLAGLFYVKKISKSSEDISLAILKANAITYPIMCFGLLYFYKPSPGTVFKDLFILIGELAVIIIEALLVHCFLRNTEISWKKSFILSIIMNVVSFFGGTFLLSIFFQ